MSGANGSQDGTGFSMSTGELAGMLGAELSGAGDVLLSGIETLDDARPSDLTFVRSSAYADGTLKSKAGAFLVTKGVELPAGVVAPVLVVDDAERSLISILLAVRTHRFGPTAKGVHPSASIDSHAELHESVTVGANAVIEQAVRIGAGTSIGPGAVIRMGTSIGERCVIGPNVTIGHEGFGYIVDESTGVRTHLPHVGGVTIGNDVDVGAGACIDRGKLRDTLIGDGCKIDNLVQIAHNCELGVNVVVCGQAALAGSVKIGARAVLAGQVGVADNVSIAADAIVMAQAGVTRDITQSGGHFFGTPARPRTEMAREIAAVRRLARRVKERRES
ncbi:MAG: UDP-3-O-(3-hydroxymyristoyl)glucosamine N-acyltransferase [Planctomycetota bacterium]